jgi:hypothetical protein
VVQENTYPCYSDEEVTVPTCPECGNQHRQLTSLPESPLPIDAVEKLNDSETILYCGPTLITADGTTPMVVLVTQDHGSAKASVAAYFDDQNWLITLEIDPETPETAPEGIDAVDSTINEEYGYVVNEMASQCIENGYKCVEQWMADGEPGGRPPQPTE